MSVDDVDVGYALPRLETRLLADQVRRYAIAGRMPGQRFMSDESAKREGLPGQIVPGNMSLSLLSRVLLDHFRGARLEKLGVTFRGLVFPDRDLRVSAFVTERSASDDGIRLHCDVVLECDGERRVTGVAVVLLPPAAAA